MRILKARNYEQGSLTEGIQEAIDQAIQGDAIAVEGPVSPQKTVKVPPQLSVRFIFDYADIDFYKNVFPGSVGFQFQGKVKIESYNSIVSNTQASPLMFLKGSEGSTVEGLEMTHGNLGNNQGHSMGIFSYNLESWLTCKDCYAHHGNGNGIRGHYLRLRECHVDTTSIVDPLIKDDKGILQGAHSAEGITAGPSCDIEGCLVENSWTTGILIYCAEDYQSIYLRNNRIRNSSLWSNVAPTIGNNPAIALQANYHTIRDVEISGNAALDDRDKPTTSHLLSVKAAPGGMIEYGRVFGNRQWGCQQPNQVYYGLDKATQLKDWKVEGES